MPPYINHNCRGSWFPIAEFKISLIGSAELKGPKRLLAIIRKNILNPRYETFNKLQTPFPTDKVKALQIIPLLAFRC